MSEVKRIQADCPSWIHLIEIIQLLAADMTTTKTSSKVSMTTCRTFLAVFDRFDRLIIRNGRTGLWGLAYLLDHLLA